MAGLTFGVTRMQRDLLMWAGVSLVGLTAIEVALHRSHGCFYTDLYRRVRANPNPVVAAVPLVAAGVVFAHLEGWLPQKADPFLLAMRGVRACRR